MPTLDGVSDKEIKEAYEYWKENPQDYAPDLMAVPELEDIQKEVYAEMFPPGKYALCTHHAFGKDLLGAMFSLTLTNLYSDECEGTILAPTFSQVRDIHFKELGDIFNKTNAEKRIIPGKITWAPILRYKINVKCFVMGKSPARTARGSVTPQTLSGFHAIRKFVIITEASAVSDHVLEQVEGITNTAGDVWVILLFNPLNKNSKAGRLFHSKKERIGWKIRQVKVYEAPNMVVNKLTSINAIRKEAARVEKLTEKKQDEAFKNKCYKIKNRHLLSPGWVIEKYLSWGESPLFRSKVIGEWVEDSENTWVTLERMEELMMGKEGGEWNSELAGYAEYNGVRNVGIGVDCAREGSDDNIVHSFEGNREFKPKKIFNKTYRKTLKGQFLVEDSKFIAEWIISEYVDIYIDRVMTIVVDMTGGYGIGVYDYLANNKKIKKSKFVHLVGIKFNQKSNVFATGLKDKSGKPLAMYPEMATQMMAEFSKQITSEEGMLFHEDDQLKNEVTNRMKLLDNESRLLLESKKDYKKRAGKSPDRLDAAMLAWHGVLYKLKKGKRLTAKEIADKIKQKGSSAGGSMAGSIEDEDNF